MVTYHDTKTPVLVGDHVEFKCWASFWRGWQPGRVFYVPGIPPKNNQLEYNGLTWVAIHEANGARIGIYVSPDNQQLKHTVRFIRRADDSLTKTPSDYCFDPDEVANDNSQSS